MRRMTLAAAVMAGLVACGSAEVTTTVEEPKADVEAEDDDEAEDEDEAEGDEAEDDEAEDEAEGDEAEGGDEPAPAEAETKSTTTDSKSTSTGSLKRPTDDGGGKVMKRPSGDDKSSTGTGGKMSRPK